MRKVVSHTILTLDGVAVFDAVMDAIVELRNTEEVLADFNPKVAEEDAMLLGRVTYQEWSEYWPTSTTEPFASHINGVPKYVASRSLDAVTWGASDNVTLLAGDLAAAVTELKGQPGGNIGVHGSPTLVNELLQADQLDEMRLEIYPVVAGTGARLFSEGNTPKRLRLAETKITANGVAILTYDLGR
jgi:dihydrofolate reductase